MTDGAGTRREIKPFENAGNVILDRAERQTEFLGDFLVRPPLENEGEHFLQARGELSAQAFELRVQGG